MKVDGLVLAFSIGLTGRPASSSGSCPRSRPRASTSTTRSAPAPASRRGCGPGASAAPSSSPRSRSPSCSSPAPASSPGASRRCVRVDAGFPVDHLLTLRVTLPNSDEYLPPPEERARFESYFTAAVASLARLPGVRSAGAITVLPFDAGASDNTFEIEDRKVPPGSMSPDEEIRAVVPGTFETLGVPLLTGRNLDARDARDAMPVMTVNEAFARKYWKQPEEAIGKRLTLDTEKPTWTTIVGIVGNVHAFGLDAEVRPEMYFPLVQLPFAGGSFSLLVRSTVPEAQLVRSARAALLAIDAGPAVYDMKPMTEVVGQSLERRRFVLVLFELFAGLALSLAAVGLYGVMAHSVAQRTHEIGVRMALGANKSHVIGLVAREGLFLTVTGVVVGGAVALAVTRVLAGLLYKVSPGDPIALAAAAVLLGAAAALAIAVPVRRAMRVDPMQALRDE